MSAQADESGGKPLGPFLLPQYLSKIAPDVVNADQPNFVKVRGQPLVANAVKAACTQQLAAAILKLRTLEKDACRVYRLGLT